MRCRDAKRWLTAQRDDDLAMPNAVPKAIADTQPGQQEDQDVSALREHLRQCSTCREVTQQQHTVHTRLRTVTTVVPRVPTPVSTDKIMLAVYQRKQVTEQFEELRTKQQSRVARMCVPGITIAALSFFALGSIPLLALAITITQTDLVVKSLTLLGYGIDILIVLAHYLQAGLTMATRNSWLLSGVAFAVVVMMGIWLRLMRYPQEA